MDQKKRQKWHDDASLSKTREFLKGIAKTRMALTVDKGRFVPPTVSLYLQRECDLRATLEEKSLSVSTLADWTAFVNRRCTLIHVLPKEGDFHIRIPLYSSMSNATDGHLTRFLGATLGGRLK